MCLKTQHDGAIGVLGNDIAFIVQEKGDEGKQSSVSSFLLSYSPIFTLAGNYSQIPDFRDHFHEQRTGGQSTVCIHKSESEASVVKAHETRFHIVKAPLSLLFL